MSERSIRCTDDEVRAFLEGRKTQTRRPCSVQPALVDGLWHALYPWGEGGHGIYETEAEMRKEYDRQLLRHCPFGAAGDRLWVREAFAPVPWNAGAEKRVSESDHDFQGVRYRATWDKAHSRLWRPSAQMPRWASRITLMVVKVRIERLQEITEQDAQADGVTKTWASPYLGPLVKRHGGRSRDGYPRAREAFHAIWDSLYSGIDPKTKELRRTSWQQNPFVYVVETELLPAP